MPRNLEDKIRNFIAFNKKQIDVNSLQPAMIANMDETPIWADMPSATTVDSRGVHTVPIKTTGHEKNRLTVCLAVKADGTKMKPFTVLFIIQEPPCKNTRFLGSRFNLYYLL